MPLITVRIMFRKEGNMKMGGFNKFFMLAMSDSVLSC